MNLIIDIGNTRVKLAVMEGDGIVARHEVERLHRAMLDELLAAWPGIDKAIVSSTRGEADEVVELARSRIKRVLEFTSQVAVPIGNAYATPETLGRDRLAAAVGAAALYPGCNRLIVDFGTAITIDLTTADDVFRGGCISPGVKTRLRSLHDYTATLPLCAPAEEETLTAVTTRSAIASGVMNGIAFEIEGYIRRLETRIENLCVIFTGGDAKYFVKRIKNTIFANCNLVFCGLNRILEHNASEENPN